jgi:plastocyanin
MNVRSTAAAIAVLPLVALGTISLTGGGPAGASTKTTTVKAIETEFKIALSKKSFSPGKYTFVVENKGKVTHALAITGPGLSNAATPDIAPGKQLDLKVTLKKGKYDFYCPIPGHKALGMNLNVSVGGATVSSLSSKKSSSAGGGSGGVSF